MGVRDCVRGGVMDGVRDNVRHAIRNRGGVRDRVYIGFRVRDSDR